VAQHLGGGLRRDELVADHAARGDHDHPDRDQREVRLVELLEDVDAGQATIASGTRQLAQHGGVGAHGGTLNLG
jgi:hypothetical protein